MPARRKLWTAPAFPLKGRGALEQARVHVEWYHGTYAGSAAGGFKTLKEITDAHREMHETYFMDKPHTHEDPVKGE